MSRAKTSTPKGTTPKLPPLHDAEAGAAFASPCDDELLFETREDVERDLAEVEGILAARLGVARADVHQGLIDLDRANELVEDDVVARWHELLSRARTWA